MAKQRAYEVIVPNLPGKVIVLARAAELNAHGDLTFSDGLVHIDVEWDGESGSAREITDNVVGFAAGEWCQYRRVSEDEVMMAKDAPQVSDKP